MAPAESLTNRTAGIAETASGAPQTARTATASPQHSTAGIQTLRQGAMDSPGHVSEPAAASAQIAWPPSIQPPAARGQSIAVPTAQAAAAGLHASLPPASASDPANGAGLPAPIESAAAGSVASGAAQAGGAAARSDSRQAAQPSPHPAASRATAQRPVATAAPVVAAQPVAANLAATVPHAAGAAHLSAAPAADRAHAVATVSPAPSTPDAFSALDRGTAVGAPAWTHAGGQHAEAGFVDPALGWVGVRADLSANGIHAAVLPSSPDAAQALSGHLAGLNSHLLEQHAPVASLSMASPGTGGLAGGMGQPMHQGSGGNAQGGASGQPQASATKNAPYESRASGPAATTESSVRETHGYMGDLRGTRISVMA